MCYLRDDLMLALSNQPTVSKQSTVSHPVLRAIPGPLESRVMEVLWTCGECCGREIMQGLGQKIAYTTVMTTLTRLYQKKFVQRRMRDRAYLYSARVSCQEWKNTVARDVVAKLLAGPQTSRELLVACLLEAVRRQDPGLLAEVENMMGDKRTQLVNGLYHGA